MHRWGNLKWRSPLRPPCRRPLANGIFCSHFFLLPGMKIPPWDSISPRLICRWIGQAALRAAWPNGTPQQLSSFDTIFGTTSFIKPYSTKSHATPLAFHSHPNIGCSKHSANPGLTCSNKCKASVSSTTRCIKLPSKIDSITPSFLVIPNSIAP